MMKTHSLKNLHLKSLATHPFARRMIACCRELQRQGLSPGRLGTLSARHEGLLWLTYLGAGMGEIQDDSLMVCFPDGRRISRAEHTPLVDSKLHEAIYAACPDITDRREPVTAIVQAYPPNATALCLMQQGISASFLAGLAAMNRTLDEIPFIPVASASNSSACGDVLASAAAEALKTHRAILLANHGVIAVGRTLEGAVANLAHVEACAEIYILHNRLAQ